MLTKNILNTVRFSRNQILSPSLLIQASTSATGFPNINISPQKEDENKRKLKKWRESLSDIADQPFWIQINTEYFERVRDFDYTPQGLHKKYKNFKIKCDKKIQSYNPARVKILGADLAIGHFVAFLGGKVKYKGHDKWTILNEKENTIDIPYKYEPGYIVEEVDLSDILLYYEALENFRNVTNVKRAIFKNSPKLDDWFVDKISSLFPNLDYLDISECPNVTERALEAIYKISNLKHLVITNYTNRPSFELSCLMLEDCCPGLQVKMCKPKMKDESKVGKT